MPIIPKEVNLESIFSNIKYNVDFYQREYKWNDKMEYKPISSLLEDIFFRFELAYNINDRCDDETINNYGFYYLNSYMINNVDGKTYIVDGQQRLTTLTIISIALLKIGPDIGAKQGMLEYIKQKICSIDSMGRYMYLMGFDDRTHALNELMEHDIEEINNIDINDATISQRNIYEAFPVIYSVLKNKLDNEHKYVMFVNYFYKRITMIQIDVVDAKDVAMTFEVINDRGVPLKAYEILKGKLVGSLDKCDQKEYAQKWDACVGPLMDIDNKYDETDKFFSWFFQSKYASNYNEHKILTDEKYHKAIFSESLESKIGFKDKNDRSHIVNIKKFIDDILPYFSKLYLRMHENKSDENKGLYFWFAITNMQETAIHNLILSAISYNDSQENEKYELVSREFDKLYTILMLTGSHDSSGFVPEMSDLARRIRDESDLRKISDCFSEKLQKLIMTKKHKDTLEDIFAPALYETAGYSLGPKFLRYLFGRIDGFMGKEMQLPAIPYHGLIKQSQGHTVYHVEHILSRNDENLSWFETKDEFEDYRDRLGALVLLKGADNQSSGNEAYGDKLVTYRNVGSLWARTLDSEYQHSNTGFKHFCERYNLQFKSYEKYDTVAIKERFLLLLDLIKIIWG